MKTKSLFSTLFPTLILCGGALLSRPASAHFLWGQIAPDGAHSSAFQLTLAEGSGEMTTTSLDKIKSATAWNGGGAALPMAATGAALVAPLDARQQVAAARQWYGVLDKTAEKRGVFLLEYEAKAARDVSQAGRNAKLGLEFFARPDGNQILVTLKHNGQTLPAAAVKLHQPGEAGASDEKPLDLVTDARGQLRFTPTRPGLYGLRAAAVEPRSGTFEGKSYAMVRHYTTLTFPVGGTVGGVGGAAAGVAKTQGRVSEVSGKVFGAASPVAGVAKLAMGNAAADPKAYAILEAAHDARQVLPPDFPGFTANVSYRDGATVLKGTVRLERGQDLQISFPTASGDDKDWIEDTVGNIVGHRRGGTFASGDGKNPLTLDGAPNDFGQMVSLHDRMNSSYRVKDNKVMEVTREAGETRFTISVMDTMEADTGKYLANHFTVAYRDKTSGELQKVDAFVDDYANWNRVWVPAERIVVTLDKRTTPRVRTLRFSDYKALAPTATAPTKVAQLNAP